MPFITLNGHRVLVFNGSVRRKSTARGRRSRSFSGQMRDSTRGRRREWSLRACFLDYEEGQSLIKLINGEGHLVRFTNGWDAATGLAPVAANLTSTRFDRAKAGPFTGFDSGALISEGDGRLFEYDAQLCDEWTVHLWYDVDNAGWQVHSFRDDGVAYRDGVRDDTLWPFAAGNIEMSVIGGRIIIDTIGSDPTALRHLAMLPYRAATSVIESWHAATKPWGSLPLLRMEGDIIATDHEFVFGEVTNVSYISKPSSDPDFGWISNAQIVEFTLFEYATTHLSDFTVVL